MYLGSHQHQQQQQQLQQQHHLQLQQMQQQQLEAQLQQQLEAQLQQQQQQLDQQMQQMQQQQQQQQQLQQQIEHQQLQHQQMQLQQDAGAYPLGMQGGDYYQGLPTTPRSALIESCRGLDAKMNPVAAGNATLQHWVSADDCLIKSVQQSTPGGDSMAFTSGAQPSKFKSLS